MQTSLRVSSVLSAAADLAAGGRQGAEAEPGPAPGRGRGPEAQHHHVPVREHSYHLPCTSITIFTMYQPVPGPFQAAGIVIFPNIVIIFILDHFLLFFIFYPRFRRAIKSRI